MSVSKSQQEGLFASKPASLFDGLQAANVSAYTHQDTHNQNKRQEKGLSGFTVVFALTVPTHLYWLQGNFLTFSCPKHAFWLFCSFGLFEIRFWPVLSHGCIEKA